MHAAIQRASAATGVDFDYLVAQAQLESGLNPNARAGTSSAAGLYQFISGTWLETVDRHGAEHGLGWADQAITRQGGRATVADPAMRAQVLSLRFDPNAAALMAAELARDNATELRGFLGREPDAAELYLAHFLGPDGARNFLGSLQQDPGQSAAAVLPAAASANRPIFFDGARSRSLGEVMELMRGKVAGAMNGEMSAPGFDRGPPRYATSPAFRTAASTFSGATPQRPSMAETLQATFGGSAHLGGRAAQRVSDAYGKFKAFGL